MRASNFESQLFLFMSKETGNIDDMKQLVKNSRVQSLPVKLRQSFFSIGHVK